MYLLLVRSLVIAILIQLLSLLGSCGYGDAAKAPTETFQSSVSSGLSDTPTRPGSSLPAAQTSPTLSPTSPKMADTTPTLTQLPGSLGMDRAALAALFDALDGENWRKKANWLSEKPIGEWYGVTTNTEGRVVELEFGEWTRRYTLGDNAVYYDEHTGESYVTNGLRGRLPPEIGHLLALQRLVLDGENLIGEIPPELGSLLSLENIDLRNNRLAGTIPPELGNLRNLTNLALSANLLSGEIPAELGNLSRLRYLRLNHNYLSGEVPQEFANLGALAVLELHKTRLVGCIPGELQLRLNARYSNIGNLRYC